jgi:hypothetical protein
LGEDAPRRVPKAVPVPDEVRDLVARLVEKHVPGHPLEAVFGLPVPAGARPRYFVRLEAMPARPLVLTVYKPGEEGAIENSVAAARTLATRRAAPSFHVIASDVTGATAPFPYRLATFLWGSDAGTLLESAALSPDEMKAVGEAIGDGLATFHNVEGEGFGEVRLSVEERFDQLSEAVLMAGAAADPYIAKLVVDAGSDLDAGAGISRLVHGNLSLGSVIVRVEGGRYELSGFVGLGNALWFDPVYDLVALEQDLKRFPLLREPLMRTYLERRPIFADLEAKRPVFRALLRVARGGSQPV